MFDLDKAVAGWKRRLRGYARFEDGLIADLEMHLREAFKEARAAGFDEEEAFRAAEEQLGPIDEIALEYEKNLRLARDRRSPLRPGRLAPGLSEGRLEALLRRFEREGAGSVRHRWAMWLAMALSYLKSAVRIIRKNRSFYFTNIAGFALGMACFLLIMMFVRYERSYDSFHDGAGRIFRVVNTYRSKFQPAPQAALSHSVLLGEDLVLQYPEIEAAANLWRPFNSSLMSDADFIEQTAIYADSGFFRVFSFPLTEGNPATALSEPYAILITESLRRKLFRDANPVGSTVAVSRYGAVRNYTVRGVLADPPKNSHILFDFVISMETLRSDNPNFRDWGVMNNYLYLKLRQETPIEAFSARLGSYRKMMIPNMMTTAELSLQPLSDIHLRSHYPNELSVNGSVTTVVLFSSIAFLILLIAGINYTNLSVAKASTRTREVGVRKVLGASRRQLFRQFIGESFLVSGAALILALGMVFTILPFFNTLFERAIRFDFFRSAGSFGLLVLTLLIGGLFAGLYPAAVLSSFSPVEILRRTVGGPRRAGLRKALVVLQFSVALILVVCAFVILGQNTFIRNKDLGFRKDQTLIVPFSSQSVQDGIQALKDDILRYPGVQKASFSSAPPLGIQAGLGNLPVKNENGETIKLESLKVQFVDEDFLDLYGIGILRGRGFSREFPSDAQNGVLVNETYVRALGLRNPLGQRVDLAPWGIKDRRIVGVVADFHFLPLYQRIVPLVIALAPPGPNISCLSVLVHPGSVSGTLAYVKNAYQKMSGGTPFKYYFLDESYASAYRREAKLGIIFSGFTILAVVISCLGLLGLAFLMADKRAKEISIRKVLGAAPRTLIGMLSKEIFLLALLSNAIAWPVARFAMRKWLDGFAYRTDLTLFPFLLAGGFVLAFALLTVLSQVVRLVRINPVKTLRCE